MCRYGNPPAVPLYSDNGEPSPPAEYNNEFPAIASITDHSGRTSIGWLYTRQLVDQLVYNQLSIKWIEIRATPC